MQKNYTSRYAVAIPGQIEGFGSPGIRTIKNSALDVLWSNTITTPSSPDDNATYEVDLSGGDIIDGSPTFQVETPNSATQSGLNALLLAKIRNSAFSQYVIPTLSGNVITLKARRPGVNYGVSSPNNDLVIGTQVAAVSSVAIDFGRFVVRSLANPVDGFNEARLPSRNTNVQVVGVTLAPRAAVVKDAIVNGRSAYWKNEAMDVVVRSNDTTGLWVESDPGIVTGSAVYIDCNPASKPGQLTLVSTNNLALPAGIAIVEGSIPTPNNGVYTTLVSLNLP